VIISNIVDLITDAIMRGSPVAVGSLVLLGMAVEIGIPDFFIIDIVLIFIGYSLGFSSLQAIMLFCSVLVGQLLGATAIYFLSRQFGDPFSRWMCGRWPKLENKLIELEGKLDEHAASALLFIRLGPGLITAASVASGLAGINYRKFVLGVGLSAFIADGSRFFAGYATFKGIAIAGIHPETWQIIAVVLVGLILFWSSIYRVRQWQQRRSPPKRPIVHSSGFNQRSCPLPPEHAKAAKKRGSTLNKK
jgi:membrane protein DedA with SNARE-associated domain